MSRDEEAMQREWRNKKHTTELPIGFVQYFITINGKPFPYHSAKNDRQSRYLVEFRECYGCGGDHPFAGYLTKKEHACYKLFHSNLHCRKGLQGLRDGGIGYKLCTINFNLGLSGRYNFLTK